jgi:ribosomal protein L40E
MLWQASFLPEGGLYLEEILLLETAFLSVGTWLVWKFGGFEEAVTRVIEMTRIWGRDSSTAQLSIQNYLPMKFCRHCGANIPKDTMICKECNARL